MFYNDGKHLVLDINYLVEPLKSFCKASKAECKTHASNWENYQEHVVFCVQWFSEKPKDEVKVIKGLKSHFPDLKVAGMTSSEVLKCLWFSLEKSEVRKNLIQQPLIF